MSGPHTFDPKAWRDFEHAGWQVAASRYHEWLGDVTMQALGPLLDAVGVVHGTRLLDVATGPGYAAAAAAQRGARAVGVDFAAAMVAEATRRFPEVEFRAGDAEALPFPDASFDAVVINFGLLHFAHPERALAEAYRVLLPGGRIGFTVWDADGGARRRCCGRRWRSTETRASRCLRDRHRTGSVTRRNALGRCALSASPIRPSSPCRSCSACPTRTRTWTRW